MPDSARLGVDWGKARIGIAAAGARTSFAYPVQTVTAGPAELGALRAVVEEYEPGIVYVGLPINLRGEYGPAAEFVIARARALADSIAPTEVRLVDERMSTAAASRSLGSAGRSTRSQRGIIDQAAAVEILQAALDAEARTGLPAGEVVEREV
ncbi:Holliday junction resolvase RuvX [Tessaracoccus oleiagri]|uniref:Putative pre-16S rRNA nuclease n=1 Tax=Tessaracoccus oleiagri TaxID=686624 RepID=A0A1G9MB63_9ACTN|nr:Holliday junction resolvase RuvX [Tessaracoccus oleiagri]SDL71488.1 putative holliday junction resolvase [Tessaracoccus oleiagri]